MKEKPTVWMKLKLDEAAYLKIKEAAARTGHKSHLDWMISVLNSKAKEVLSKR